MTIEATDGDSLEESPTLETDGKPADPAPESDPSPDKKAETDPAKNADPEPREVPSDHVPKSRFDEKERENAFLRDVIKTVGHKEEAKPAETPVPDDIKERLDELAPVLAHANKPMLNVVATLLEKQERSDFLSSHPGAKDKLNAIDAMRIEGAKAGRLVSYLDAYKLVLGDELLSGGGMEAQIKEAEKRGREGAGKPPARPASHSTQHPVSRPAAQKEMRDMTDAELDSTYGHMQLP